MPIAIPQSEKANNFLSLRRWWPLLVGIGMSWILFFPSIFLLFRVARIHSTPDQYALIFLQPLTMWLAYYNSNHMNSIEKLLIPSFHLLFICYGFLLSLPATVKSRLRLLILIGVLHSSASLWLIYCINI